MPFTFSHPLYSIPLKYISPVKLSLTGLILGSMAPDFEYFLMLEPYRTVGHSITGLFVQAIPLSILFAFVFHYIIKESLAIHLPSVLDFDGRAFNLLGEWRLAGIKEWILFVISVTIGFISHVFLDAFTHAHSFFVVRLPFLRAVIFFNYPLYKILQYSLSVLGLLILFAWVAHQLYKSSPISERMPTVTTSQKCLFWFFAIAVSFVVTGIKLLAAASNNIIGILVVAPISGLFLGLLLASLISKITKYKQNNK